MIAGKNSCHHSPLSNVPSASFVIVPQLAAGDCTPSPIKLKNDSEKIAAGIVNDKFTIIMPVKFGIKCPYIIFICDVPNRSAAITNSLCFKDKTCALTRRAIPIHPVNARAMIMVKRPGFITINSKITINKYGIPYNTSIPRIIHSSINVPRRLRPLTYPLNPPISTPSPISRAAATNPTVNEIFPPAQVRAHISLPKSSVPNQRSLLGGKFVASFTCSLAVNGVKLSPTSEKTIMSNNVTDPKTAIGFDTNLRNTSFFRLIFC
ncbi:Uncharacterised protein [Streptococcus pneumoniae]|nr:Uncharacterised protein [Streptococcus pneumoniae]